eukprot:TRINITY_DN27774_c0_g1_i1.p2 TRINITY_DN27774_c0_g1~~TRINITY_DN27774_c0_g1_i1.p2  ORF type:complete len:125 (+),score=22.02 TRINITY_DN27774_c0_g1_i1:175-549(+)
MQCPAVNACTVAASPKFPSSSPSMLGRQTRRPCHRQVVAPAEQLAAPASSELLLSAGAAPVTRTFSLLAVTKRFLHGGSYFDSLGSGDADEKQPDTPTGAVVGGRATPTTQRSAPTPPGNARRS